MARQVFSKRFITKQGLSGSSSSVTVPLDEVYVIKQLTLYTSPSFGIVRGFFMDDATNAALFSAAAAINAPGWFGFYGALVFEPGTSFHWHVDSTLGDAADVYAGGYALTSD